MMIDVVGAQSLPRKLRQEKILFVGGAIRSDHAKLAVARLGLAELGRDYFERLGPGNRLVTFFGAHHGRLQAVRVLSEIESVAAFHAEELIVDAAAVAVVAAHDLVTADTQRGFATIGAVGTDCSDVFHFPRPRLISIRTTGERAHGTNVDAGAALVAFQVIAVIRNNFGNRTTIADAQRSHSHAFVAGAHAAVTQDAARCVEIDHGRPLLFVGVELALDEAALARAVAEHHVLQLALTALVAHRTIQRMIRQQEFERTLARLLHHVGIGAHHHALGHRRSAANLQLRSLFYFHQAHAAGRLQRVIFVITEGRHFDAVLARHFDQQLAFLRLDLSAVDGQLYEFGHR